MMPLIEYDVEKNIISCCDTALEAVFKSLHEFELQDAHYTIIHAVFDRLKQQIITHTEYQVRRERSVKA